MRKMVLLAGVAIAGLLSINTASAAVGPSFNCTTPGLALGARLVCSSPELSRIDLIYAQSYYVMRQIVGQAGWQDLKTTTISFEAQTLQQCGIPSSGTLPAYTQPYVACLERAYMQKRAIWLGGLTGAALEEAQRPIEQHITLQQRLQSAGFLPVDAQLDGIYGIGMRVAIYGWQRATNRPQTGFISDSDAAVLDASAELIAEQAVMRNRAQAERIAAAAQRAADEQATADREARIKAQAERDAAAARQARIDAENKASAQLAAENSPDNRCREPTVAGELIQQFNNLQAAQDSRFQSIDIEHLTTVSFQTKQEKNVYACHGVFVLTNGRHVPGTLSTRLNVASNVIISFAVDDE